jgi:hypothetical protein
LRKNKKSSLGNSKDELFGICTRNPRSLRPLLVLLLLTSLQAYAGLDHALVYDKDGLYSQNFPTGLEASVIVLEVTGALWLGNDDPLGHTFWQTIDSSSLARISFTVLKYHPSRSKTRWDARSMSQ